MHWSKIKVGAAAVTCAAGLVASGVALAPDAKADGSYQIAWTGIGIYPKSSPSMDAGRVGAALPDGAEITPVCDTTGQPVDNGAAVIDIWEKLADGSYVPNAFVNTGADGFTPGVPRCIDAAAEQPLHFDGVQVVDNGNISDQLLNHYYDKSGTNAVVDWSYFSSDDNFVSWLESLPVKRHSIGEFQYTARVDVDGPDMVTALGHFSAERSSNNCFVVYDRYDFSPNTPYFFQWLDAQTGAAKSFDVWSSGCI